MNVRQVQFIITTHKYKLEALLVIVLYIFKASVSLKKRRLVIFKKLVVKSEITRYGNHFYFL